MKDQARDEYDNKKSEMGVCFTLTMGVDADGEPCAAIEGGSSKGGVTDPRLIAKTLAGGVLSILAVADELEKASGWPMMSAVSTAIDGMAANGVAGRVRVSTADDGEGQA